MLSLPKGLSTPQSSSVQPCWKRLLVEMLHVPAEGGFSQPCYAAAPNSFSKADESVFSLAWLLGSSGVRFCLIDFVCKARSRELTLLWASFLPWARVSCEDGHGDAVPAGTWQIQILQRIPPGSDAVCGASHLGTMEGVRVRTDPRNALLLVPFCCPPPLWVVQRLLPSTGHSLP